MHIIEDMPVASQLSTLKVEVLDASHCPLLGRVQGTATAKYMGEVRVQSSSTGHLWLPSLKVHALISAAFCCNWLSTLHDLLGERGLPAGSAALLVTPMSASQVGTSVLTERHLIRFEGEGQSAEQALLARLEIRKVPAEPAAWRLQLGASSGAQGSPRVCSGEALLLVIGACDMYGNRWARSQLILSPRQPRSILTCVIRIGRHLL